MKVGISKPLLQSFNIDPSVLNNVGNILRAGQPAESGPVKTHRSSNSGTSSTPVPSGSSVPVSFYAIPSSGTAPLTVEFVTSATGGDVNYVINFGDKGGSGTAWMEKGLTYTYVSAATYTANLYRCAATVSLIDCRNSAPIGTTQITVSSPSASTTSQY